jgi:hypothetical protein
MKCRAFIICLFLLSQPFSSFAAVWQPAHTDGSGAGDLVASHCDTEAMAEHQRPESDDATANNHSDCSNSCDLCAACAAVTNTDLAPDQMHAHSGHSLMSPLIMPPGQIRLLFRPPI